MYTPVVLSLSVGTLRVSGYVQEYEDGTGSLYHNTDKLQTRRFHETKRTKGLEDSVASRYALYPQSENRNKQYPEAMCRRPPLPTKPV